MILLIRSIFVVFLVFGYRFTITLFNLQKKNIPMYQFPVPFCYFKNNIHFPKRIFFFRRKCVVYFQRKLHKNRGSR